MSVRGTFKSLLAAHPRLDGLFRRYIWSRIHFPEMEMKFLNDLPADVIDVAIDVGAALGPYSWILNRKARRIFAFEPGEEHGLYLQSNVVGTRITLVRAAVGDVEKIVQMYTPGTDTNAFHTATLSISNPVVKTASVSTHSVKQITLDGYLADKLGTGAHVDLIKVDVEGYENEVFLGARDVIGRHLPLVICEIEVRHNPEYSRSFHFFRDLGYSVYVYDKGAYRPFAGDDIAPVQSDAALVDRLSGKTSASRNAYLNNFIFQHPRTRIKVFP